MQIKSLKIFCDIVALHSFSKAAEENGMSQSSVSQVVHQLEERLGVPLIDRSTRPFRVTAAGEKYYDGSRGIVRQYEELEREVLAIHGAAASRLTVAAIYSVGLADMSSYIDEFAVTRPQAEVRIEYLHPDRVYEAIEAEEADFGIVSYASKSRRLAVEPWRDEPFVVVCPPDHRLASQRVIDLRAIEGMNLVAYERGLLIREKIDRLLAKHKVEARVALEFDNIEHIKRAIETGVGVSLLPAPTVVREVASGALAAVRLSDPSIVRPLGIVYRRDRELSSVARAFIDLLQSHSTDNQRIAPTENSQENSTHAATA